MNIKLIRRIQDENTKGTDYKSFHSEMAVLSGALSALSCHRLPIIPGAKLLQLFINSKLRTADIFLTFFFFTTPVYVPCKTNILG